MIVVVTSSNYPGADRMPFFLSGDRIIYIRVSEVPNCNDTVEALDTASVAEDENLVNTLEVE